VIIAHRGDDGNWSASMQGGTEEWVKAGSDARTPEQFFAARGTAPDDPETERQRIATSKNTTTVGQFPHWAAKL
jgi:hypothetical protein